MTSTLTLLLGVLAGLPSATPQRIVLAVHAPNVLADPVLDGIEASTKALEAQPGVARVESLARLSSVRAGGGDLIMEPWLDAGRKLSLGERAADLGAHAFGPTVVDPGGKWALMSVVVEGEASAASLLATARKAAPRLKITVADPKLVPARALRVEISGPGARPTLKTLSCAEQVAAAATKLSGVGGVTSFAVAVRKTQKALGAAELSGTGLEQIGLLLEMGGLPPATFVNTLPQAVEVAFRGPAAPVRRALEDALRGVSCPDHQVRLR